MNALKRLLSTTAGKAVAVTMLAVGGYEGYEHLKAEHPAPGLWSASTESLGSMTSAGSKDIEFQVKSAYQTQTGRVLLGNQEDYLDPSNTTLVVPAGVAKQRGISGDCLGKIIRAKAREGSYKGKKQWIALDANLK